MSVPKKSKTKDANESKKGNLFYDININHKELNNTNF